MANPAQKPAISAASTSLPIMVASPQWQGKPMAWRVSCAALWAALRCEKPTAYTMNVPKNRQTMPAASRCELDKASGWIVLTLVMNTLRATVVNTGDFPIECAAGLLTSRVFGDAWPSRFPSGFGMHRLAAHSCGGSHGIGPDWVILTVFPVRPSTVWLLAPSPSLVPACGAIRQSNCRDCKV